MRISKLISEKYKISVRQAKNLLHSGAIHSGKSIIKKDIELIDSKIDLEIITENNSSIVNNIDNIESYLLLQNKEIIFLFKPPFMHVDRHRIDDNLTLSDIVQKHFSDYRLLSRLDYEASGIIAGVRKDMEVKSTSKKYLAIVSGIFKEAITLNKKVDAKKKRKVSILDEPSDSPTIFTPIKYCNGLSLVKISLDKARRHQVRAYLSYLGYPILNDKLYGKEDNGMHLMLFCYEYEVNGMIAYANKEKQAFENIFEELIK